MKVEIMKYEYLSSVDLYYVEYMVGSIEFNEYVHRTDVAEFADNINLNQSSVASPEQEPFKYEIYTWLEDEIHGDLNTYDALVAYLNYKNA